ncbi:dipeptidyl aminopeptidase [Coniophora puteana RWD-64-598 SS2]|uniref:Dipeptidyl aminopeptidase n=1 Tax=Coniophora puteana (strain RWD-64-598) TaxID=741705 RepID=A0A5M3M8E4_CONPW|nr:dipeptidyl aminopeptidase [Coniophora puteana RWD-64-598 SS2]EIW75144.1 dipeptidyl aminopeptidase [Coniophora puteana RWD-64-598 SS2]
MDEPEHSAIPPPPGAEEEALSGSRPPIYYGEGPFDAPSSDEDEDELLEKMAQRSPALAERAMDGEARGSSHTLRLGGGDKRSPLRVLVLSLAALVFLAACIGVFAASTLYKGSYRSHGHRKITMDHVFNGTFSSYTRGLDWVPEAGDGVFSTFEGGTIKLVDLKTNTTSNLVSMADIRDEQGAMLIWSQWKLSADMKFIMLKANQKKQWRHSSFGNYYIHNLETKETVPLRAPSEPPVTAYAAWSPTGQSIAFVTSNDLYVLPSPTSTTPIRITSTGNASLFHGVPDWVYEEEVFEDEFALWWSPDASRLAFLSLDETLVDEFRFPVYNPTQNSYEIVPYTDEVVMKYPKPGYANPIASVSVFDLSAYTADGLHPDEADRATYELDWEGRIDRNNSVITEVAWVGNGSLILKEITRAADDGNVVYFDLAYSNDVTVGKVVRKLGKDGEEGDDGWIDSHQTVLPLPGTDQYGTYGAYLDIVPDANGYNHIALFDPVDSDQPRFVTTGEWEVTDGIQAVDAARGLVYFQAANPSTERHLYSVPIPTIENLIKGPAEPTSLTDESVPGSYGASFSPKAGFYLLNYRGPNVPWQRVVQVDNEDFEYVLTEHSQLNATLAEFEAPVVTYSTIESDGYELNVREMRPPRMDDSGRTKYPVLFFVYGGPVSQQVNVDYKRDWHDYLVCGLQYIVVTVDGRGTGFKGRNLRNPVKNNLGYWETVDQINAARIWAGKSYVDRTRIGVWGWSFGGFMGSKVAEANAGVHSLAMSVAPVTSWRYYDSVYTERYMGLPSTNPDGYVNASISHVEGFHNVDFLLAHGSGDDNVHYANSAHLLDMLTADQVRGFWFRMFTDSEHGMKVRGAYREVYEFMLAFLLEKWGKGGRTRG